MKEVAITEKDMREAKEPWPHTRDELDEYIDSLVERSHDYGTCVYAMSLAAAATFNYVAHKLGVTGFQASCADFDFLRRTRGIDGPFMLIKGEDMIFPQYDIPGKVTECLKEWEPWAAEQAVKKIAESNPESVAAAVMAHWKNLAKKAQTK